MARYFFHLRDGRDVLLDPEGIVMATLAMAQAEALRSARSILAAEVIEGKLPLHLRIDVEDGAGVIVHRLPFTEAIEIISE